MVNKNDPKNVGQPNEIDVTFTFPIQASETVQGVQLALFYDTKLITQNQISVEGMIYSQYSNVSLEEFLFWKGTLEGEVIDSWNPGGEL